MTDFLAEKRRILAEHRAVERQRQREQQDQAAAARDRMAAELGYPNFAYMLSIGLVNAVRNARRVHRQAAE